MSEPGNGPVAGLFPVSHNACDRVVRHAFTVASMGAERKAVRMSVRHSPTVRRRRLGTELRRLREYAGITCEQAAEQLGCSTSKISRMENARVPARLIDVQALCQLYRADAALTEQLVQLTRDAKTPDWWQSFDDAVPDWFETFLGMEAAANAIRTYEIQLIPGLLQTEGYIRALLEQAVAQSAQNTERIISLRQSRQQLLHAEHSCTYWAIVSEAALCRLVGGPEVMRDQLLHVAELAELDNVTVQVIPNESGAHPAMATPFVIIGFPERADPDVVFLDHLTGALYLEKPHEVAVYDRAFNHLIAAALPPRQSVERIRAAGKSIQ
jgi:transcriptional regulator with XRE-family HTH domain